MELATWVQILDETVPQCLYSSERYDSNYSSSFLILVWQSVKEKEHSEFKPVVLYLKKWPCVTMCLWYRSWVNIYIFDTYSHYTNWNPTLWKEFQIIYIDYKFVCLNFYCIIKHRHNIKLCFGEGF